jgi:hypothetical protein
MAKYRDQNTGATREISGRAPGFPWQLVKGSTGSKRSTTKKTAEGAKGSTSTTSTTESTEGK